jgi:hypothetical protein
LDLIARKCKGGWRTLHNELHNLYSAPSIRVIKSRRMEFGGHVACIMEEVKYAYKIMVGKHERKRPWKS